MSLQKFCYLSDVCFDFGGPEQYVDFQVYIDKPDIVDREISKKMILDSTRSSKILAFCCSYSDFNELQGEMYYEYLNSELLENKEVVDYVYNQLIQRLNNGYADKLKSYGLKGVHLGMWICY